MAREIRLNMPAQMGHDDRYDMADEFLDVAYGLWQRSWDDDAVVRRDGVFADPRKIRAIHHAGKQFRLDARHLCEPSPQRTPVLYQAGASERGRAFAARHAECVFLNGGAKPMVAAQVADLRARCPRPLRVFLGATVIVGRT